MKKIMFLIFIIISIINHSDCIAVNNNTNNYFNSNINDLTFNLSDLNSYSGVVIKRLTIRDSMYGKYSNKRIMAPQSFINIFGNKKLKIETKYVYIGDNNFQQDGYLEWRYYNPPSWNGRAKGEFKYDPNIIMKSGYAGDLLVIGKKNNNQTLLLIVKKDSKYEKQVYDIFATEQKINKAQKTEKVPESVKAPGSEIIAPDESSLTNLPNTKGWIRIYFSPGTECQDNIVSEFNNAKKSINIAVYAINNPKIFDALSAAHNRGVKIKVITDRLESSKKNAKIITEKISDLGIDVRKNKKYKIEHNKFAVFDDKNIVTGSYNWTINASNTNSENCLFFEQPNKEYSTRFNYLWEFYGN